MADTEEILIVAGEASGDAHAAKLVRALREEAPTIDLRFFGAAGPKMREAGVDAVVYSDDLSVVGLAEIGRALPMFLRAMKAVKNAASIREPKLAILVDFPDFNLKLAKWLKTRGFKVVYYISPQLWAWREYRLSTIKNYVDLVISILPFEKEWYRRHGVEHVEYVGSPLAKEVVVNATKDEFCRRHGLDPSKPIIALLPGSRHKELVRILPTMLYAATLMSTEQSELQFVVALASAHAATFVASEIEKKGAARSSTAVTVIADETYEALNAADAAAITSGTATLEAGIIGTPMVVVYKTSALNYRLFEPMIDVQHYGLINLIAGKRVAIELIQHECTPDSIAKELSRLLEPATNTQMRSSLRAAADKLGHGGASKRAAVAILKLIADS
jgi:lipid-A-disaccharide synthase